jgi:hypothetical protein
VVLSYALGVAGLAYTVAVLLTRGRTRGLVPSQIQTAESMAPVAWWALASAIFSTSWLVMPSIFSRLLAATVIAHPVLVSLSDVVWLGIGIATLACLQLSLGSAKRERPPAATGGG